MNEIIEKLTAKDEMSAYEYCKQLVVESAQSAEYYKYIEDFAGMLDSKNSYVRTRGFGLICYQARWDDEGKIAAVQKIDFSKYKDSMSPLIKKDADELLKIIGV